MQTIIKIEKSQQKLMAIHITGIMNISMPAKNLWKKAVRKIRFATA
jgi:hypothetical protein